MTGTGAGRGESAGGVVQPASIVELCSWNASRAAARRGVVHSRSQRSFFFFVPVSWPIRPRQECV